MEKLFQWMSSLSKSEATGYSILLFFVLLIIPYLSTIFKISKKIIIWQRLNLSDFNYYFYSNDIVKLNDGKSVLIKKDSPEFVIEGSKFMLHWMVEGALWVKLYPGIGKVSGNAAEIIITRNRRLFTLEARGIFSKKKLQIEVPTDKIKTLETTELSNIRVTSNVKHVKSFTLSDSQLFTSHLTKIIPGNRFYTKLPNRFTSNLNYKSADSMILSKNKTKQRVENQNIVKIYTFRTKKYEPYNKLKSINYK